MIVLAVSTACVAILTCLLTYLAINIARGLSNTHGLPHIFQPFHPFHPLLLSDLVPFSIAPLRLRTLFNYKWKDFHRKLGSDIVACIMPFTVTFVIGDADIAHEVMETRREEFVKPDKPIAATRFGPNVVSSEGATWRRHRKITSAGFTERNNKLVVKETNGFLAAMVEELKQKAATAAGGGATIDISPYAWKVTLSVICKTSFGMDCSWDTPQAIRKGDAMTFFESLNVILSAPGISFMAPRWLIDLPFPKLQHIGKAIDTYYACVQEKVKEARKHPEDSNKADLFSILIKNSNEEATDGADGKLTLSEEELLGNIFIFLVAGHETSSRCITFALGLLALHQDVQEEFYNEITSVCTEPTITYENAATQLKLGVAIMNESLRLFPIAGAINRLVPKATTLGNGKVAIPAGSHVLINFHGIHYHEKYWGPTAAEFDPHRFLRDYKKEAFLPFSDGPRACLGRRFAQLEITTVLASLVRHFHITCKPGETKETLLKPGSVLTLAPENPVMLTFTPRQS